LRWFGVVDGSGFIAMDLFGETLAPDPSIGKLEVLNLFLSGLRVLEKCHNVNIIHRDLKPSNIAFLDCEKKTVGLLDFGLATRIPKGSKAKRIVNMIGNRIHSSHRVMERWSPGFGDDIIGFCYSFIDVFFGGLPWSNEDDLDRIMVIKKLSIEQWVSKECPKSIMNACSYGESLSPGQTPHYSEIYKLLHTDQQMLSS